MTQTRADPRAWIGASASLYTERLEKRRQNVKIFAHPDGRGETAVFGGVLHYEPNPGFGMWEDADTALRPNGADMVADHLPFSVRKTGTNLQITDRSTGVGISYVVPAQGVTITGNLVQFSFSGIDWTYTVARTGVKLTGIIPSPRGNTSFSFNYARMGGSNLTLQPDGSVSGNGFSLPAPYITGANGKVYLELTSWSVSQSSLTLNLDDTSLPPEAYPYVLDPSTTFSVANSADDGRVQMGGDTVWPPTIGVFANTAVDNDVALRDNDGTGVPYYLYVGLIGFNTSTILDAATITSATLRLNVISRTHDASGRMLTAEYYDYGAGIDTADWTSTVGVDAHGGTAISSIVVGDNDFTLNSPDANINKSGDTRLRLHISGASAPSGNNEVVWASFDHASLAEPRLIVDYTYPNGIYAVEGQTANSSGTSATAITVTLPAAPTDGNLLVAMVSCAGSVTPTATGAWNKLTQIQSTDTGAIFWKLVPASDTAAQTLTSAGTGSSWAVVVQEFGGVDPTTQLLVQNNQASTTTSKASPSISPTAGKVNALIVGGGFTDGASRTWSSQAFTGSFLGSVTVLATPNRGTGTGGENCNMWFALISSTTGSYTATATCSAADGGGCAVAIFNPVAAAPAAGIFPPFPRRMIFVRVPPPRRQP